MKKALLLAIKFYQATQPMRLPTCRFYPSCSHYAKTSIEKHGTMAGLTLALKRILRCHPLGGRGVDFVPDTF